MRNHIGKVNRFSLFLWWPSAELLFQSYKIAEAFIQNSVWTCICFRMWYSKWADTHGHFQNELDMNYGLRFQLDPFVCSMPRFCCCFLRLFFLYSNDFVGWLLWNTRSHSMFKPNILYLFIPDAVKQQPIRTSPNKWCKSLLFRRKICLYFYEMDALKNLLLLVRYSCVSAFSFRFIVCIYKIYLLSRFGFKFNMNKTWTNITSTANK